MIDIGNVEHHEAAVCVQEVKAVTFEPIEIGLFDLALGRRRAGRRRSVVGGLSGCGAAFCSAAQRERGRNEIALPLGPSGFAAGPRRA